MQGQVSLLAIVGLPLAAGALILGFEAAWRRWFGPERALMLAGRVALGSTLLAGLLLSLALYVLTRRPDLAPVQDVLWAAAGRTTVLALHLELGMLARVVCAAALAVALVAIGMFESKSMGMFFALFVVYLLHTTGELCVSPVGLSMVTKLAPTHMTGIVMGAWFLSISMGNYVAGIFSALAGASAEPGENAPLSGYTEAFTPITYMAVGAGVLLMVLSRPLNKLMHGIK